MKNHGRQGGIRQTPGYLQKQPCPPWHMVQRPGHWPNKHRTNLRLHRPKWKEVCSTSHTKIEGPTSGSGSRQKSCRWSAMWDQLNGPGQGTSTASKMDLAGHHLGTIYDEKRQWRDDLDKYWLERHNVAEDSKIQANLGWRQQPEAFGYGCLMMTIYMGMHSRKPIIFDRRIQYLELSLKKHVTTPYFLVKYTPNSPYC